MYVRIQLKDRKFYSENKEKKEIIERMKVIREGFVVRVQGYYQFYIRLQVVYRKRKEGYRDGYRWLVEE